MYNLHMRKLIRNAKRVRYVILFDFYEIGDFLRKYEMFSANKNPDF